MIKPALYITLVFGTLVGYSQNNLLLQTQWLGMNNTGILIKGESVKSAKFDYFSSIQVSHDTLKMIHDYSHKQCYTKDSLGNEIECKNWKLPNSHYQIIELSKDRLILYPLNTSAMKIAGEINNQFLSYGLDSYQKLIEEQAKKVEKPVHETNSFILESPDFFKPTIDTVKLQSKESIYEDLKFDSLCLSYEQTGWFAMYYYDVKIDQYGKFIVSHRREGSDKGEFVNRKAILGQFYGNLHPLEIAEMNNKLSYSGINKMEYEVGIGWSSHGRRIRFKVYYNGTNKEYSGEEYLYPVMLKPLVSQIQTINRYENFKEYKGKVRFETSYSEEFRPNTE